MLSDEEKEIFNNLKEYMQSKIDNGYHKFIYNDLDWDFKCIDCINAIDNALKQSKEIEDNKKYIDLHYVPYEQYTSKLNELNKKWKDKIKAKIEPVLKQLERKMQEEYNKYGNSREYQDIVDAYNFLQSLLEKE